MKTVLCLLALGGVVAQLPPDTPEPPDPTEPSGSKPDSAVSSSGSSGESTGTTTSTTSWNSGPSGTGSYAYAGSGWGNTNWGSVGGSGSGWDWLWDGDAGWGPNSELWHFRPSWNWDSPYPPEGTMYVENWGNPPTREIPARRSFYLGADNGVSLAGATVEGGHADCGWRDWCVHLTFHSSYGVLSDFDAFVLDRYDSADRIYGDGLWNAREDDQGPPRAFAPLVLGGFSPEERAVLGNISSWRVEEMARRFNETRTTTWTLYPDSDEMDVILSFKQLFTLLPGYPNGNVTQSSLNSDIISEWGPADQVLLRVTAKRQGSGATSSMMPRVLNFTGSQLFQVEYFSSLEYPQNDDGNLNASANAMTLDVVFSRRRYGSGLPWNPARPSDACDACNQRVMNHPVVARCLHGNVPERIFQDIYEQSASEQMEWDGGEWNVGDMGAPSNLSYNLNDVVDSCFGLRWLLSGQVNDGSWSSSLGFPDVGDHRSSSGSEFGDAGFRWSGTGSGSGNDGGSRYSSEYRDPVYRYDESGSRWSSWGYRDDGSASKFGNAGSRRSSSGSSGGPNAGDWPSVRDLWGALAIARETDAGIQCLVESRCPVGTRNFAEAAGRMVVLEHEHAFVRVNFTKPSYKFYVWMALAGLGPEGQFKTPVLSSDNTPGEIAELVAQAVPNASEYNLAVDVRMFNNSELIAWVNMLNEWMADYYKSGGSESEASAAWAEYSSSSDSSSFQFPPVGEASETGDHPNAGQQSDSVDGSSPDAGQGSDGSGRWWFGDPYPVPEPQFTVQISLRNVSVIPNILEVVTIGDESMDSAESKVSYDARGSELRFQLSPLNLTKFEYVPPPPYVNLTWSEDTPDYPDLYWNGSSIWNDTDIWSICSECADAYTACDNSVSCSLGVHGFLERGLSQSRFNASEISGDNDNYNRQPWGVDFGPTLRQSASFFTSEGYDTFMDFMVCLHKSACALDLPRQAYNYSKGEYDAVGPTQLEIIPAESVFVVPTNSTGGLENIVMRFQDKESVLEWSSTVEEDYPSSIREFVEKVMSEYSAENKFWTRNPSQNAWAKVDYESEYYRDGKSLGRIFRVTFADNFFNDAEQPRFRPISADTYDELNSSNWKVLVFAYRNPYDEGIWDGYPIVTWRKLATWLSDLGYNSSDYGRPLGYGDITAEDTNICYQCLDAWTQCISNQSCADAMRQNVIQSMLFPIVYYNLSDQRSSMDFSASLASWRKSTDSGVYTNVLEILSCLSKEACPVGYAFPSDPSAPLVPVTTKLVSHFAMNVPLDRNIVAYAKDYSFDFVPSRASTNDLAYWLRAASNYQSDVKVQVTFTNESWVRFEATYYPAVAAIPAFYFTDDVTSLTLEGPMTFASVQLSSNRVQYGQRLTTPLLESWFWAYLDSGKMFYTSVDIFRGTQVCHGCPECWEALTRCQNDMDCNASARNVLVPLLRNVTLPLSTSTQSDGPTLVKLDFSSALLSLENDAFQSREGWLAFAHLLHAMSSCGCEVGFGQWNTMKYEPTRVRIESDSVDLSVRLYPNTQLDVWFNGNLFSYSTDGASSPNDAANNFLNWFTTTANSEPFYLVVDHIDTTVDDISQSATITLKLYGVYDVDSESQPLVNPNWIPNFFVKSDDVSAVPPAEVNVTPWKISLQSTDRYPPFDRLLDLLEYGAASDEMPSSYGGSWGSSTNGNWEWSASGSYAAGSFSGDACARCADLRQACFDDMDCQSAISNYLLPTLNSMGSWPTPDGYSSDMSSQVLSNVFGGMQSSESKRKLFALLTCSATKWTSTPSEEGVSCVQLQATTEYPDGNAMLEIIPAFSVFPINKGQGRTIYTSAGNPLYPTNTPLYYSDNGDSTELTDFMENQILGGYDNTGVKVKVSADWNSEMYNVIFDGLTATSTPYVEGETSSSTTQFKFSASTDNMVAMFSPWMQWLDPGLAS